MIDAAFQPSWVLLIRMAIALAMLAYAAHEVRRA